MYKINFTEKSHSCIHNFITYYKNSFLDNFTDTGLYNENEIRNEYIKNSITFKDSIYD
jgi:hypothetical protein